MSAPAVDASRRHYDEHLGPVYSWMLGGAEAALARARAELRAAGLAPLAPPAGSGVAIDLGAGPGFHAIALAELGFEVLAVDRCAGLLDELTRRAAGLPVRALLDDLEAFRRHLAGPVDAVLCLGDTLPHLPGREAVARLLADAAQVLTPGGTFLASLRDHAAEPPEGRRRTILVRADDRRLLTCDLEYGDDVVLVRDLVHERRADGWHLAVSAYPKLRLAPGWIAATLERAGLDVRTAVGSGGMTWITARRPAS